MSRPGSLPGRLKGWLRTLNVSPGGRASSRPKRTPEPDRDLDSEFERFLRIGDRLERGLEELKDLQWQIRENETRYRDLLDNQADVILRRDAEGRLTFVNQAFCRVFGRERAAVLGQPFRPRVSAGDKASPLAPGAAIRHQRYVQEIETAAGLRWFEWEEHAVPAGDGAARRSAVTGPRHHRDPPRSGAVDRGTQAGRGRQPGQVALPGRHEP